MSRELTKQELHEFHAAAPRPPILPYVEDSVGIMECPICFSFKPGAMLAHIGCGRMVCSDCCILLFGADSLCPCCRDPLGGRFASRTSGTSLRKLSPAEFEYASKALFHCSNCSQNLSLTSALKHTECQLAQIRQPPAHLQHTPRQPATARDEVVSNAPADDKPTGRERLLVIRLNGRQLRSFFLPAHRSIERVEREVGEFAGVDPKSLKTFKFIHKRIDPTATLRDVARTSGATYLSMYTDKGSLEGRSANLLLEEIGLPAVTPQPQQQEQNQQQQLPQEPQEELNWD